MPILPLCIKGWCGQAKIRGNKWGANAPHLTGDGPGFVIELWRGSNSDKQTQTSNNKTVQTQLKRGVYTSGWVVLLACLTSVHTNLSFVPVLKTTLLLPTLSCLHAPLTLCNWGSKPPLINQIILMPSGLRSCLQTQDLYPEQRMENLRDSPLSVRLKYGINGGVLWKWLMCTWML